MGLMIHSLAEFPTEVKRDYYVYLLDYGWHEPLSEALMDNFGEMGKQASQNNAIVFKGTVGSHFENEVLSWHSVNGEKSDDILPAILITSKHPNDFKEDSRSSRKQDTDNLILIPIKNYCKTSSEVITLIQKIFCDIRDGKNLKEFQIKKEIRKGISGAIVDAVILEPNFGGIGINLKPLFAKLFKK